jgi:hypothetical protein
LNQPCSGQDRRAVDVWIWTAPQYQASLKAMHPARALQQEVLRTDQDIARNTNRKDVTLDAAGILHELFESCVYGNSQTQYNVPTHMPTNHSSAIMLRYRRSLISFDQHMSSGVHISLVKMNTTSPQDHESLVLILFVSSAQCIVSASANGTTGIHTDSGIQCTTRVL